MMLKPRFLVLLLSFLALAIYYPSLFAPYNSLDDQLLVQQLLNTNSFSLARHFAPGGTYDYYRPLVMLSFELDKHVGGLNESFMHFINILLHTLNVVLVYFLARRAAYALNEQNNLLPFLSAVLFCIHPLNTEAVNWITARTDLLAATFIFTALILMLAALERHSLLFGGAGTLALFGGFLCKETVLFVLPGIFLLLIWKSEPTKPQWSRRWFIMGFCVMAVGFYFAMRAEAYTTDRGLAHSAQFIAKVASSVPVSTHHKPDPGSIPLVAVAMVTLKATGFYAAKLFQPFPLNFAINKVDDRFALLGALVMGALAILTFRRRPVGVFFVLSALVGSSALMVLFTRLAWTPIAERYMYIPSGFFVIGVVFGSCKVVERFSIQKVCMVLVPLLLMIWGWATVNRNILWQDNLSLYQDTVSKSPTFDPVKNELAQALYAHNRPAESATLINSIRMPSAQEASLNKASVLIEQKHYREGREFLLKRLENPGSNELSILRLLVKATMEMAEISSTRAEVRSLYQEIVPWLERIEQLTHDPFAWYQLGRVHLLLKNRQAAQHCFSEAAKRFPADSMYRAPSEKLARKLAQ